MNYKNNSFGRILDKHMKQVNNRLKNYAIPVIALRFYTSNNHHKLDTFAPNHKMKTELLQKLPKE